MSEDLIRRRTERLNDFAQILLAGTGFSRAGDPRETKFFKDVEAGEVGSDGFSD